MEELGNLIYVHADGIDLLTDPDQLIRWFFHGNVSRIECDLLIGHDLSAQFTGGRGVEFEIILSAISNNTLFDSSLRG